MTLNEKARIIFKIELYLQKAYDRCRDDIDYTEDLSAKVIELCQQLRFIERMETATTSRHSGFTKGSVATYPGDE